MDHSTGASRRMVKINDMKYFQRFFKQFSFILRHCLKGYIGLFTHQPWYIKMAATAGSLLLLFLLYVVAVYVNLFWLFGKSPSVHAIMHPQNNEASEIYTADSVLIGKYFSENRSPVRYEDVNPMFFHTLIDTEDERFYSHHGVDLQGILSAVKDMFKGNARGASTITQQLVKNMFRMRTQYSTGILGKLPGLKMLIMKTKEWILAVELECFYDKQDILTMYVNTVDFGSNAYGIKTAAKTYFNTTPSRLKVEEGAVLVGLLKATSTYNPKLHPQRSQERRNVVLYNLYAHRHLTQSAYDSLRLMPIQLQFSVENAYDGEALHFRQELAKRLKELFEQKDMDIDLYADGLKIYTTLHSHMQRYAEEAVNKQMKVIQKRFDDHWGHQPPWQDESHREIPHFIEDIAKKLPVYQHLTRKFNNNADSINYYLNLPHPVTLFSYDGLKQDIMSTLDSIRYMVRFMHAGFVAIEPLTRHVKAWVGDIDFRSWKYDKVTALRQPGSTFKLFVYAEAMNQGYAPCDMKEDSYVSYPAYDPIRGKEVTWAPHNANGYFSDDSMTLRAAFAQSINSIAVKTGLEVGISNIVKTAHDMGIHATLDPQPSLTLGAADVSLLELINAYATVAANGQVQEPVLILKIVDRQGNIIYDEHRQGDKPRKALPYRTAFLMQQMLRAGLTETGGTSMALWPYIHDFDRTTDFGGKTGTSNNHSDAWYVGVTPGLVGGAWVGGEYRSIHFQTGALGQGSRTALPIFGQFIHQVLSDPSLAHYQQKFGAPAEQIAASCYQCENYQPHPRYDLDSLYLDSIKTTLRTDSFQLNLHPISEEEVTRELSPELP